MSQINQQNNQNTDAFAKAAQLRAQAEALEAKERMKIRLKELMEISKDPYYDRYLRQMLKDLESGKATPTQIAKEADRTFRIYQQRMGQSVSVKTKNTMEYKVGAGIFSILGALLVLSALVIWGFNCLEGIFQGIFLYVIAGVVILISNSFLKKISKSFSSVISAMGISSLFVANVINYLVLKNINGLLAALFTVAITVFSAIYSRKMESTFVRFIGCLGCYICFLPVKGFENELSFLMMTGMLFVVNLVFIFLPNQRQRRSVNCVHLLVHVLFTVIVTCMVIADNVGVMYVALFVVMELIIMNLIYLNQKTDMRLWFTVIYSVALGIFNIILICVVCMKHSFVSDNMALFYKLMTETMVLAVSAIFFILWTQEKQRWIQYCFATVVVITFNGFTDFPLETVIAAVLVFLTTRLLCRTKKELYFLDSVCTMLMAVKGICYANEWYAVLLAVVLLLSVATIKNWHIYHQTVVTVCLITVVYIKTSSFIWGKDGWSFVIVMALLLGLFLLFNHLPMLKGKKQLPYNIVSLSLAGGISVVSYRIPFYWIHMIIMLIGATMITVAFQKKYQIVVQRKYLVLAGYCIYMILTAGFDTPVMTSGLLMGVAVGCVAIGFGTKDKVYRICGLAMALVVYFKMVLYDFTELETVAKALLAFAAGVITLIISFLYMYLERRTKEEVQLKNFKDLQSTEMEKMVQSERSDIE